MQPRPLLFAAGIAAILCFSSQAFAQDLSAQEFVTKASTANMFEIKTSKLALEKSHDSSVKKFAQQMVNDHGKTKIKMKAALAQSDSKAVPATELTGDQQEKLDELSSAKGKDFDEKYVDIQTDAHHEAVDLFGDYAENGTDPVLKDLAAKTLPTLKGHLKHIEGLKKNS